MNAMRANLLCNRRHLSPFRSLAAGLAFFHALGLLSTQLEGHNPKRGRSISEVGLRELGHRMEWAIRREKGRVKFPVLMVRTYGGNACVHV